MKIKAKVVLPTAKKQPGKKQSACFLVPVEDEKTGALQLKVGGKCSKERLRKVADAARRIGVIFPREEEATA
jgi:hypothetical protein